MQSATILSMQVSDTSPQVAVIFEAAVHRYIAKRRARVAKFVRRQFSLVGSCRLHRYSLGWDLLRAPLNVLLVLPLVVTQLLLGGCSLLGWQRAARWLRSRSYFLPTNLGREIEWRIYTELLELPIVQQQRRSDHDALAEEILADPQVATSLTVLRGAIGVQQDRQLQRALQRYTGTRAASAELTNSLIATSAGAFALGQFTPGGVTLGPALATLIAHQIAVASFPLGATLGAWWYNWFPTSPSLTLSTLTTLLLMLALSAVAVFSGILTDPLQRYLGFHQRRLMRLLDALEGSLLTDSSCEFSPKDHYTARLFDLMELVTALSRHLR